MELIEAVRQLFVVLFYLTIDLVVLAGQWALLLFWLAWALLAINWSKVWPWLAKGAWGPAVLLLIVTALIWSQVAPGPCQCLSFVTVPSFWWQLGAVGLIAALTLFCGWLQGQFGWTPAEINLEPPAHTAAHGHAHH